jgi:hypothetical protein
VGGHAVEGDEHRQRPRALREADGLVDNCSHPDDHERGKGLAAAPGERNRGHHAEEDGERVGLAVGDPADRRVRGDDGEDHTEEEEAGEQAVRQEGTIVQPANGRRPSGHVMTVAIGTVPGILTGDDRRVILPEDPRA